MDGLRFRHKGDDFHLSPTSRAGKVYLEHQLEQLRPLPLPVPGSLCLPLLSRTLAVSMIPLPLPATAVRIKSSVASRMLPGIGDMGHEPRNELVRCDLFGVVDMVEGISVEVSDLLLLSVIGKT